MTVRDLFHVSPMAVLGIILMGIGVAAWFIGLPLYALHLGFTEAQASGALVIAMVAAGLAQYPLGWLSDNTDRRYVVVGMSVLSVLAGLWMAIDATPARVVIGFSLISAVTLPVYSILAAHANDLLKPSQIVPASGTMAFLLQLGQVFGIILGPNVIQMAGGRGLPILVACVGVIVTILALARRARRAAPDTTGEVVPTGVLGTTQPGRLQAEVMTSEKHPDTATETG